MAGDLRMITTGMKINAELERIADLAVNISQRVMEVARRADVKAFGGYTLFGRFVTSNGDSI